MFLKLICVATLVADLPSSSEREVAYRIGRSGFISSESWI